MRWRILFIACMLSLTSCDYFGHVREAKDYLDKQNAEIYRCANELADMYDMDTIPRETMYELACDIMFTIENDSASVVLDKMLGED